MKKEGIKSELISAFIPLFLTFILDLFFYINTYKTIYIADTKPLLLSIIIVYSIFILLYAIFKETKKANIILAIIIAIFSITNQIKIFYMEEPIIFSDFAHLFDMGEIVGIVKSSLGNTIIKYLPHIIIASLITVIFAIMAIKNNIKIEKKKHRIVMAIIPIMILAILFLPFKFERDFMLKNIFDTSKSKDYEQETISVYRIADYGVIAGMYKQWLESKIYEPQDYNEEELNKILASNKKENNTRKTPNIILMFSESFWDINELTEIQFDKPVTSNFNKLKHSGKFVNIISPSYGGLSTNVEFELLTGANTSYFNTSYIPYMNLYKDNTYYNRDSVIKELKKNGYRTKVLTGNSKELYNCGKVYKYMKIDETEYLDSITDENYIKGYYISDEYITNRIIEDFNNKKQGQPMFYMAQTMQAHMPYEIEKYNKYDISIKNSKLNKEMNEVLLSYAQGIYDADQQLGRLYEYIQSINEETIIVFLGDHLPYLKTLNGDNVLDKLQYFNTADKTLNVYRKYNTQGLILANYDISDYDDVSYLGDEFILTYILNNTGMEISNYYSWIYSTKDIIASNNHFVAVDRSGAIYNINELTEEMKRIYKLREKMQYKLFVK